MHARPPGLVPRVQLRRPEARAAATLKLVRYARGSALKSLTPPRQNGCPRRRLPPPGMERLWSQAGATGGNPWQTERPRKPLKHADPQPVATDGNGPGAHGKEGVDGSSPSEGSRKGQQMAFFVA
jgi:hypothetical protein